MLIFLGLAMLMFVPFMIGYFFVIKPKIGDLLLTTLMCGILSTLTAGAISFYTLMIIVSFSDYQFDYSMKLYPLEDNYYVVSKAQPGKYGEFVYAFRREWDGGFRDGWVRQYESTFYTADSNFRLDVYHKVPKNEFWKKQIQFFISDDGSAPSKNYFKYKFYIPQGGSK